MTPPETPQPTAAPAPDPGAANGIAPDPGFLDATLKPGEEPAKLQPPKKEKYDPEEGRDKARANITYWLLGLLTLIIFLAFIYLCRLEQRPTFEQLKNLIELLLGPVIALVSAATGFYFGAQAGTKPAKDD